MDHQQEPSSVETPFSARRKRSPKRSWAIAVLAIFGLAVAGLGPKVAQGRKLQQESDALARAMPSVTVASLSRSSNASDLTLPSNIQAIEQTTINARTTGYVAQRLVDIGYHVSKGQLLAVIESPELDQQLSQSAAEATKAQAGLGTALADSARQLAAISAAQAEQTKAEAARTQALAELSHLRAKVLQAKSAVDVARSREAELSKRHMAAAADRARAQSQLNLASKTYHRWKELEKAEAVAGQDVDEKLAALESAQAVYESADATVSSSQAAVDAAHNDVAAAQSEVAAAQADVQSGIGRVRAADSAIASSRANVTAVKAAYRASRSGVESASATISSDQANVRRVAALQSFERVTAPFGGVITSRNIDTGDLVNSSPGGVSGYDQSNAVSHSGLFGLAKTDVLRAQVSVPEDSANLIRNGMSAQISVAELPKRLFQGTVFNVSGALDAATRTLLVEVRIPNLDGALKPGMYAQLTFANTKGANSLWLPANALIFNASGTRVAVITSENTVHYVAVKLGRDLGDRIEVLGGLTGSESVETNPDDSIVEGANVTVVRGDGS